MNRMRPFSILLGLLAFAIGSDRATAVASSTTPTKVCASNATSGATSLLVQSAPGSQYVVTFVSGLGARSVVGSGVVGPTGVAGSVAPSIGVTPLGMSFLEISISVPGGTTTVYVVGRLDPGFIYD